MIEKLNWYPGHMKKTRELIQENLKLVDLVVEVIDARIPVSSRNPVIDELIRHKQRVIVFNKSDLADARENDKWIEALGTPETFVIAMNCVSGAGTPQFMKHLGAVQEQKNQMQQRKKPLRLMIVGVPNVGKSSLINRLTGKRSTQTGDRPGVTKGKQWLNLEGGMQLLDTPGILWPKFEDPKVGLNLAFCGSIKDEILDIETLALELIRILQRDYPEMLMQRYRLDELSESALDTMEAIALKRGFILPGKRVDYERTAKTVLDEFRSGIIGKITLEHVGDEK